MYSLSSEVVVKSPSSSPPSSCASCVVIAVDRVAGRTVLRNFAREAPDHMTQHGVSESRRSSARGHRRIARGLRSRRRCSSSRVVFRAPETPSGRERAQGSSLPLRALDNKRSSVLKTLF